MDEISSLDSFHTEPESTVETNESLIHAVSETTKEEGEKALPDKRDKLVEVADTPVVEDTADKDIIGDTENPEDEEYEQISDSTLEQDDNALATSANPTKAEGDLNTQQKQTENIEEQQQSDEITLVKQQTEKQDDEADPENTALDPANTTKSVSNSEKHGESVDATDEAEDKIIGTQESTDFEEVDTNVSASGAGDAEESDMLGESDMTLPTIHKDIDQELEKAESLLEMELDKDNEEEEEEGTKSENEAEVVHEKEKQSVEKESANDDKGETSKDSNIKGSEKIEENKRMDISNDDDIEKESIDAANPEKENADDADKVVEQYSDANIIEIIENSNESRGEEIRQKGLDNNDHNILESNTTEVEATEVTSTETVDDDEPEQEDEPVENVQEPEESDVCLIPDDTETKMTEAEKEQAILARENAEKEDEQATKAAETAKEQLVEAEKNDVAESAGVSAAGEAPDGTDEPLLEEMQSGGPTGDIGNPKIIIAWIVASNQTCTQCCREKLCGFRYKNPETAEPEFICDQSCCDELMSANQGKYFIRRKKFLVEEILSDSANVNPSDEIASKEKDDSTADDNVQQNLTSNKKLSCMQCKETKSCKYFFKQDDEMFYVCNDDCFNLLNAEEPDKFKLKRHSIRVRNIGATSLIPSVDATAKKPALAESRVVARTTAEAEAARLERASSFTRRCADCFAEVTLGEKNLLWETMDFCNEICLGKYQRTIGATCQTCHGEVPHQALGKYCVRFGFEIRQFCCAACLNEFKKGLKTCSCCQKDISSGNEGFLAPVGDKEQFKDFCSQACMRRYDAMCNPKKKTRNDICAVCNNDKQVRVEILLDDKEHNFCSNPCFSAFKFVSNIVADQCGMCCKYFERKGAESFTIYTERRAKVFCSRICLNVYIIVNRKIVSCQWCKVKKYNFDMIYKQQDSQEILMCSLNCLTLYGVSINAFSRTVAKCDNCSNSATPQYHLTMSDASMRNFCTYQCVMQFQSQFARAPLTLDATDSANTSNGQQSSQEAGTVNKNSAPFPTGLPKRVKLKTNQPQPPTTGSIQLKLPTKTPIVKKGPQVPVISTVSSLASGETETMIGNVTVRRSRGRGRKIDSPPPAPLPPLPTASTTAPVSRGRPRRNVDYTRSPSPASLSPNRSIVKRGVVAAPSTQSTHQLPEKTAVQTETKIVTVPPYPPAVRNVQTSCKPQTVTVGFQCEPTTRTTATQTGKDYSNKVLIPVPVPIYIPQPMYMYSAPFPVPVPIPLPIPVPIFIPTTRNSAQGILKEIKKIQDKMPADPFEAELLMMAEMVAEEKRESDSDSEDEIKPDPGMVSLQYENDVQQVEVANNSYGEDVLQMALKMATGDYDQPTVDLESAMTASTITNPPPGMVGHDDSMSHINAHHMQPQHHIMEAQRGGRGRKRGSANTTATPRNNRSPAKRQRLQDLETSTQSSQQNMQPVEKPDANMCLKFTFGVNAWKQWVMTKNADLEKSSIRRRSFKTELLQMTADELNYSLCLFVKEVRKPNGTEYAPDTIYYLVLGIQQYLYENGRIDNIFTDPYYERFTDCLDEVARKFSVLYNDSQYIVTRVEEEHLWECKQLGAHSPHVLLSTLMFFNTKHFNLTTVEEHMQLSFSHIMKHWKRSAQNAKSPGTRNVLLRFYPPQAGLDANPRKKKVYEQQENEDNPLRCPVRLYEFYLSKCPESVKTRNDVFYLQPERSCVPDSPVWYSTQALSQEALQKMLHRVKMVKEINIALLTS